MSEKDEKSWLENLAQAVLKHGPGFVMLVLAVMLVATVLGFALLDPIIGAKSGEALTGNVLAGWLISLATTAVITIPIGVFAFVVSRKDSVSGWTWIGIALLLVLAFVAAVIDITFDGYALDVYRFGRFIDPQTEILDKASRDAHVLGRWLLRILSLMGDAGAGFMLGLFPMLKKLIEKSELATPARPRAAPTYHPINRSAPPSSSENPL